MKLEVNGQLYKVHFRHFDESDDLEIHGGKPYKKRGTVCTIHEGECANRTRPCNTPGTVVGKTYCNPLDMFDKLTGRKTAFGRALTNMFPNNTKERGRLWEAYFLQRPQDKRNAKVIAA